MVRDTSVYVVLAVVLWAAPAWAQRSASRLASSERVPARERSSGPTLSSPSAAARFWDIASEVVQAPSVAGAQADQAILLLTAAAELDKRGRPTAPLLLKLAGRSGRTDYSDQIILWLQDYVDPVCDQRVVRDAVQGLLNRQNSWEGRKKLLEELGTRIGNRNPAVDSDLAMLLGFLMGEKGDVETAKFYLTQAYKTNKYNKIAFAKLVEIAPNDIGPGIYLEHLRLVLRENPLDLTAALNFAQYAERLQLYDTACLSYQYCAELFRYLYPTQPLPPHIYLPWAITSYNTSRGQPIAMQIAENVRSGGRLDILLEAIAGRAAAKMGNPEEAQRICRQAEEKAQQFLQAESEGQSAPPDGMTLVRPLSPRQLAWFYCFADCDPKKAMEWANRAYATEPNAPSAGALLAYALAMNNQMEWAKSLLPSCAGSQIADLVQARIQLAVNSKVEAIQTLKTAVTKDPGSLAAEQARQMLRELQSEYVPPIDTNLLMKFLAESLGQTIVPQFLPPEKTLQVQFTVQGSEFAYGGEIEGVATIVNQGSDPLMVTEDGLFQGNLRVDARVSGSLTKDFAPLVVQTVGTSSAVQPGRSLTIPLRLSTGELRNLLDTYAQASLDIEFTLYLDPVVTDNGSVSNRLVDVKTAPVRVKRPGMQLSGSYVRNRYNAVATGPQAERIETARLFTGLLKEQYAMAGQGTLYPFQYAEWMPGLLRSALTDDPGLLLGSRQDDWVVAIHAMADMLSMPVDEQIATVVAKNLNHPKWPVRLMAIYLLANSSTGDFQRVLDWVAQNDANELVRRMAMTLKPAPSPATGVYGLPSR